MKHYYCRHFMGGNLFSWRDKHVPRRQLRRLTVHLKGRLQYRVGDMRRGTSGPGC